MCSNPVKFCMCATLLASVSFHFVPISFRSSLWSESPTSNDRYQVKCNQHVCPCVRAAVSVWVYLCVCVCVLLCACVCLVSTDIKLLVCTTSQRTTATASQQSARSQSSLVLLPLPGSFPACFYMYIYQDISGYIYICECVCNPNATWAKDGDRLPVEFVSFASFSPCFFFFLFIP